MHTHALTTAMTLYRAGTLSLSQAAQRAGYTDTEMATALRTHGITVREPVTTGEHAGVGHTVQAD